MLTSTELLGLDKPPGKWGGKGGGWKGKGWYGGGWGRRGGGWWNYSPEVFVVETPQQFICPVYDKGILVNYVRCPNEMSLDLETAKKAGLLSGADLGRNGRGGRGGRGGGRGMGPRGGRGFGPRGGRGRGGRWWGHRGRGWGRGWWWGGGPTWIEVYNQYLCPVYDKGVLVDYILCPVPQMLDAATMPIPLSGPELGAEGESCVSNVAIVSFTIFAVAAFGALAFMRKKKET